MVGWIQKLLKSGKERRHCRREPSPMLGAYYFDGGSSTMCPLRDISEDGAYIETSWPWAAGTLMRLTLNKAATQDSHNGLGNGASSSPAAAAVAAAPTAIVVHAEVVRTMKDGMGVRFQFPSFEERRNFLIFLANADRNSPAPPALERGQSLIEVCLILPLLFLLIVNVVNFGGFFYAWITVANAARNGAQYAVLNSASVGGFTPATGPQISNLITQDAKSLPNNASLTVNVCQNNNGTITVLSGTCSGVASDPEPASYILTSVDVTYTYQPFIPFFDFPTLHIHATLPPTTIHRRAYMRIVK